MEEECKSSSVGIVSMECYFPKSYISQSEYETYNNVSSGKYTIGLGQNSMSFISDREDICSICLTVLSNLITKNNISYHDIGWICVATETIIDHSKSISSSLQELFKEKGNNSIEGIDVKHACYGGTFALFTAFDRINSKYWDGKYCIVISADIAEYSNGPARCTGGCGAIALLLGSNACIDLNITRSTYKANEYDFYKPYLNSPYPVVNGHVSNKCYINAFDSCYNEYKNKLKNKSENILNNYWIFHAPYNKLVQKTFGRLMYNHFLNNPSFYYNKYSNNETILTFLKKYEKIPAKDTVNNREVIKTFEKISKDLYNKYVLPSTYIPKSIGNCYTASIFMGLISLIYESKNDINNLLLNKNIQMFSYGSGTIASMYSLKIINSKRSKQLLNKIIENNNIEMRFNQRCKINCHTFTQIMNEREQLVVDNYENKTAFIPTFNVNEKYFYNNTYYLTKIDSKKQRFYDVFKCDKNEKIIENTNKIIINNNNLKKNLQLFGKGFSDSARQLTQLIKDENGLSKQGAIKIDKVINKTEQITTKCSNS